MARKRVRKKKKLSEGKMSISLPPNAKSSTGRLNGADEYKHVGNITTIDAMPNADAKMRYSKAMTSYCPLSAKIVGSCAIDLETKLQLAESLIFSRLFYNVHLWSQCNKYAASQLSKSYMATLRKCLGCSRFKAYGNLTDAEVLQKVNYPDIHMRIRRMRLAYLPSLFLLTVLKLSLPCSRPNVL